MQSKGSRKELPEKELKIRFYMKAPTLILKGNKPTTTAAAEHRKPLNTTPKIRNRQDTLM
jgi:hypothetical protein